MPAQNEPPAPVRMPTDRPSSPSSRSIASAKPLLTSAFTAFLALGRLMVMIRMRSRCSTSTTSSLLASSLTRVMLASRVWRATPTGYYVKLEHVLIRRGDPMATSDIEASELTKWDPGLTERVMGVLRPFLKRYFRSEVRGLENMPPGGALLVSNHSGGMLPMDVPILSVDFYDKHGYDRPLYTLSHDMLVGRADGRLLQEDRLHQRQPRERRRGAALRRPCRGVPRRRLRRVPADAFGEQDRLRRPHRLRQGRAQRGRADRADRRRRRSGDPDLPDPRDLAGQAPRADRTPGAREDRADLVRFPVRPEPGRPAEHSAARQDHHAGAACPSTSSPSSARTPTSTRSTPMSATSCSGPSTNWPPNAACRSSAEPWRCSTD